MVSQAACQLAYLPEQGIQILAPFEFCREIHRRPYEKELTASAVQHSQRLPLQHREESDRQVLYPHSRPLPPARLDPRRILLGFLLRSRHEEARRIPAFPP